MNFPFIIPCSTFSAYSGAHKRIQLFLFSPLPRNFFHVFFFFAIFFVSSLDNTISSQKPTKLGSGSKNRTIHPPCASSVAVVEGEAFSLKGVVYALRALKPNEPFPAEIVNFAGISRLSGFLFDPATRDVILFGKTDPGLPKMFFIDFVAALQNANEVFAVHHGNTISYSYPGCSIDPSPNVLANLHAIVSRLGSGHRGHMNSVITDWFTACKSPQKIRVMGVPFSSHFAKVMVKADYEMKSIVDGTASLPIKGFTSLLDRHINSAKRQLKSGHKGINLSSMNRFWFNPGKKLFAQSPERDVFSICKCAVKLSTEEEFLSAARNIRGTGRQDRMAAIFASDFSNSYDLISSHRDIFYQLANLFRMFAIAQALQLPHTPKYARDLLRSLWKGLTIPQVNMEKQLPGRANVKGFQYTTGRETLTLYMPSCGGVGMNMNLSSNDFYIDRGGILRQLSRAILHSSGRKANAVAWRFKT